ncbi:MAG: hypothetical protein ACOZF2_11335 [Thermodesulfobacteriota bacterium]
MAFIEDPRKGVKSRISEIERQATASGMDAQELAEREEAAQAYAGENEKHFVEYLEDCVQVSMNANDEVRKVQDECWRLWNEEEPPNYAAKEAWQSRVVLPMPHASVLFAMALIRKAFDVQFLSIENERNQEAADFRKKLMTIQLSRTFSNFPLQFSDACGMSCAVGTSMEMIPVYRKGRGLKYLLIEPWKIYRDPDAVSREPQSGLYWIHSEYLDYWQLKKFQKEGRYTNIGDFKPGTEEGGTDDKRMTKEAVSSRRKQIHQRSKFRTLILTSEFWGTVLDPRGELLLPNASYTTAGGRVIKLPEVNPYPTLRWPGTAFSVIPHPLRFDGRGLLQGIKTLWEFMCSLLSLHADYLNWLVNPPIEIDVSSLVDKDDLDWYPGKQCLTYGTLSGQQAYREIHSRSTTTDVLANLNFCKMSYEDGVLVPSVVRGLPGYRAEVTARESAQNLDQSMTVFGLMGFNIEQGALEAILAGAETLDVYMPYKDLELFVGPETALLYADPQSRTGLKLPSLSTGQFTVSGISAMMQDWEQLRNIREVILPLFDKPEFVPYLRAFPTIKAIENRLNLKDEGIRVDDQTGAAIEQWQRARMGLQAQAEDTVQQAQAAQAEESAMAGVAPA